MKADDYHWMGEAIAEARKGVGFTAPNPAVGAVVVKKGVCIGRGYHAKAGSPHAEPNAIRDAGSQVKGADLYVTLEPCSTTGKTPPCTEAIKTAGIRRVVIGCMDPNPAHAGRGPLRLSEAGIEVVSDVRKEECEDLIRGFARVQLTGLPYVTLKLACTLDGRLADASGTSKWITGAESRDRVQALRREVDAVLVGTETVRLDDPSLMPRPACGHRPWRIIPDRTGRLSLNRNVFTDAHASRTLCLVGKEISPRRVAKLRDQGVQVLQVSARGDRLQWRSILKQLAGRGIQHLLCEGGGALAAALLKADLVQELHWISAPKLLGENGTPAVADSWTLAKAPQFHLHQLDQVGQDTWMWLRY